MGRESPGSRRSVDGFYGKDHTRTVQFSMSDFRRWSISFWMFSSVVFYGIVIDGGVG